MTNSEKAIAELFSILCAVIQSEKTSYETKQATISTFAEVIGKDNSVFQNEELLGLTLAMDDEMKKVVNQLNGNRIINEALTNSINLN
jgi:hypothetical protein